MESITKVALKEAKDFAKPFEAKIGERKGLFWRWFLLPKEEVKQGDGENFAVEALDVPAQVVGGVAEAIDNAGELVDELGNTLREKVTGKPPIKLYEDSLFEKGVDYDLGDEAEMAFQLGKYQLNQDVLKNIVGAENVKIFKGENSKQQLEDYLKQKVKDNVISQEDADKALTGNKNAMFIGNEFVLMEDVALAGIANGGASALFAASSPLHELLHRDLIEAGIVVDSKIVKSAEDVVASIEDHLNSLSENNLIDKKNAKIIKNRIEQYKSKEGVDLEIYYEAPLPKTRKVLFSS